MYNEVEQKAPLPLPQDRTHTGIYRTDIGGGPSVCVNRTRFLGHDLSRLLVLIHHGASLVHGPPWLERENQESPLQQVFSPT
jgi:hypothetical protein